MELNLEKYNVRDATMRSLLALANEFGIKTPTKEQMETLAEISEELEARVQDEMEKAVKNFTAVVEEAPPILLEGGQAIHLVALGDDEAHQVVVDGVIYGKLCNEYVAFQTLTGRTTTCIKQWAHITPAHEDIDGNERL